MHSKTYHGNKSLKEKYEEAKQYIEEKKKLDRRNSGIADFNVVAHP